MAPHTRLEGDCTIIITLLSRAHRRMDADVARYAERRSIPRRITWEAWSALPGRRSCVDGRPL